jgi:asparagine synthase (glutamine-hydrolysing)
MATALRHRGPDAIGVHDGGAMSFAHARLAIVDLVGGGQPMFNEDRRICITYSGEIYNHVELRQDLAARGHVFRTRSDTEVLVHLYEELGPDLVHELNGQWAFAIWDGRERSCLLSRDRLGVRPLYYARAGDQLVFASEMKALFLHPDVPRTIDARGLDEVFTLWTTIAPRTPFEGVFELPPGCSLVVREGDLLTRRYWQIDYPSPDPDATEDDHARNLRDLLIDATRLRLRADVPVGAYLSGGIDSSVIVAIVKRYTDARLETFSVTFDDPDLDESRHQRHVVRELGIEAHHEVRCAPEDIGRVFPDVVRAAETPLVRAAPAPLFLLSRLVHERGFKVVLTGEGADELLGGYDIFKEAKVRRFCARSPTSTLRPRLFRRLYPYLAALHAQPDAYLAAFFHARPEDLGDPLFSHAPRFGTTARIKLLFSSELRAALARRDVLADLRARLPARFCEWDPLCRAQYLETAHLLPGYILSSQGDRVAMAHGVEGRFPFLDPRIADLAARLPPRLKVRALEEKYLLKKIAADLVPPAIRARSKQPYRAFDAPSFFDWRAGKARFSYVDDLLAPQAIRDNGLFDPDAVARLVAKAKSAPLGTADGMSIVAVLSTQLVVEQLAKGKNVG